MQTFLPYPEFDKSAKVLDYKRLGKQRVEVLQILQTLANDGRWRHHPAVKMWKGYELTLSDYGLAICREWIEKGYRDTCYQKIMDLKESFAKKLDASQVSAHTRNPDWLGNPEFHASHRSNLLRKLPEFYGKYDWQETNDIPYYWPTKIITT